MHICHILSHFALFLCLSAKCNEVAHREGVAAQPLVVYNCHPDIFKSPAVCTKMCSKFANQYVLAHWSSSLLLTILQTITNCNQPHSGAVNIIAFTYLFFIPLGFDVWYISQCFLYIGEQVTLTSIHQSRQTQRFTDVRWGSQTILHGPELNGWHSYKNCSCWSFIKMYFSI